MSEESTTPGLEETVSRTVEAFNRSDFDAALAVWAPNAVWDGSPVGGFLHEGRETIRALWEELTAPYEDFETAIHEAHDLGNGVIFTAFVSQGRLRGSSGFVEGRFTIVLSGGNGLIERATVYAGSDQARAAAERLAQERGSAVSRENVEVVKRALDAFNRGDLDGMLVEQDAEFEWRPAFGGAMLDATSYRGQPGFRDYWRDAQEIWDQTFSFDAETFSDGGDTVVVVGRGRGRARGVEVGQPFAMMFRLRGGKLVFGQTYTDPTEALRAAGLEG